MSKNILDIVAKQRDILKNILYDSMFALGEKCIPLLNDTDGLEQILQSHMKECKQCKYLWVLDNTAHQITATVSQTKLKVIERGRDRAARPYMSRAIKGASFYLSQAYISRYRHRPSLTAVQTLYDDDKRIIGFVGADFDLRQLPHTAQLNLDDQGWLQLKGDPAIRGGLFAQQRITSAMDDRIDDVFSLMQELIIAHGVFHAKFHFSSSRATVWLVDSPYDYQVLNIDELTDASICLAFPHRSFFSEAKVSEEKIKQIFAQFKKLRFADETIYLRSASLNIVNEKVGLNFSCDGSHYVKCDEFLEKDNSFWFGVKD